MAGTLGNKTALGYRPYKSDSSAPYVLVGDLKNLTPPKYNFETGDTTTLDSDDMEIERGLAAKEASFTVNFNLSDADYETLEEKLVGSDESYYDFAIIYRDLSKKTFTGTVIDFEPSAVEVNGVMTVDFTIKGISNVAKVPKPTSN